MIRNIKRMSAHTIIYLMIITGVIALKSCNSEEEIPLSYQKLLDEVDDDTSIDEVLKFIELNPSESISLLETRLLLSNQLHSLKLSEKVDEKNIKLNLPRLSDEDINQLIQLEKDNELSAEERMILLYNEGLINNWLYKQGYDIARKYGDIEVKSKVLDAINKGNDSKKMDCDDYDDIHIYGVDYKHGISHNKASIGENEYRFTTNLDFLVTLTMKEQDKNDYIDIFGNQKYNEERNRYLTEIIKYLKSVLITDYEIENNNIIKNKRYIKY